MESQRKLIESAVVLVVFGGLALIYGVHGVPPEGGMAVGNPNATMAPLANAFARYYVNAGSLVFGILAIVLLAFIWRGNEAGHRA